ncbi:MAG: prolipoprotein diacylglyceryl transferase [Deltaproteobacteria bacterium]|nr:prolipoprotein diacylglyceryl transferase [Deltaproteobacteria bacterium]
MAPVLFKIGPFPFHAYGTSLVLGFFAGYLLLRRDFRERGVPPDFAAVVLVGGMFTGIVGSRVFHVIEHLGDYRGQKIGNVLLGSGFSWYGGFLLTAVTMILLARRRNIHWSTLIDAASPALIVGYGFGRIGCLIAGDGCYGKACEALGLGWPIPLCMAFPKGAVPMTTVVLNAPLFEIAGAAALFVFLQLMRRRITTPAGLFALMLIIHAVMRFLIEFVRINPKLAIGLTQAQWVSIIGVGLGIWLMKKGPEINVPVPRKKFSKKRR